MACCSSPNFSHWRRESTSRSAARAQNVLVEFLLAETVTIPDGQSVAVTLFFTEASAPAVTVAACNRVSVRPIIAYVPPDPCFTAVSAEVVNAITFRTNIYAMPQVWNAASAATTVPAQ